MDIIDVSDDKVKYEIERTFEFSHSLNIDHFIDSLNSCFSPKELLNIIKNICNIYDSYQVIKIIERSEISFFTIKDCDNCTVLHWAASSGSDKEIIKVILGIKNLEEKFIFTRNISGNTALHMVVISACEHAKCIAICQKTNENPKKYVKAYNNCKDIVKLLIDSVENKMELIKVKNKQGKTAKTLSTLEILQILQNYYPDEKKNCCFSF